MTWLNYLDRPQNMAILAGRCPAEWLLEEASCSAVTLPPCSDAAAARRRETRMPWCCRYSEKWAAVLECLRYAPAHECAETRRTKCAPKQLLKRAGE